MHVEAKDENGETVVRDAIVAAFFCRRPYREVAASFGCAFDRWLTLVPDKAKVWAVVGPDADELKALDARRLSRAWAEFDALRAQKREMAGLTICGPQRDNPDWQFDFLGHGDLQDDETNYIELRFPTAFVDATLVEFERVLDEVASCVPYDCGYASPALVWGSPAQQLAFASMARKWAFRHPGFDVPYSMSSSYVLGEKLRGAYWTTWVGPAALAALGGEEVLRRELPKGVVVRRVGAGLSVRASRVPEIGDVNRLDRLPVLRGVAKALEKVTLLDDNALNGNFVDQESRARWQRRHLD